MKTISKLLKPLCAAFALMGVLVACGDKDAPVADLTTQGLRVVSSNIPSAYTGGEGTIVLSEDGFTAKSNYEWCSISVSGTEIKVQVARNEGYSSRTANINIVKGNRSIDIPVTQLGTINFITNLGHLSYEYTGGELSYPIQAQATPDIKMLNDGETWLSYRIENGQITFTAQPNEGPAREARIEIIIGAYRMAIMARQARNPNGPQVVEIVEYADIVGKYILEGQFIEEEPITHEVEIVPYVPGQLFLLKGLALDVLLIYDEDKRGVRIPMLETIEGYPNVQLLFIPDMQHLTEPRSFDRETYLKAPTMYANGNRLYLNFTCDKTYVSESTGEEVPITGLIFWDKNTSSYLETENMESAMPFITSFSLTKQVETTP